MDPYSEELSGNYTCPDGTWVSVRIRVEAEELPEADFEACGGCYTASVNDYEVLEIRIEDAPDDHRNRHHLRGWDGEWETTDETDGTPDGSTMALVDDVLQDICAENGLEF